MVEYSDNCWCYSQNLFKILLSRSNFEFLRSQLVKKFGFQVKISEKFSFYSQSLKNFGLKVKICQKLWFQGQILVVYCH